MPRCTKPAVPAHIKAQVKALYLAGDDYKNIAAQFAIKPRTVNAWAMRYGWRDEKNRLSRTIVERVQRKISDTLDTVAIQEHQRLIGDAAKSQIDRLAQIPIRKASDVVPLATALKTLDDVARRNLGMADESRPSASFCFSLDPHAGPKKVVDVPAAVEDAPQIES